MGQVNRVVRSNPNKKERKGSLVGFGQESNGTKN